MVQVDRTSGTDRVVRIQTSAPVEEVKRMFLEKHLVVIPIETSLDAEKREVKEAPF